MTHTQGIRIGEILIERGVLLSSRSSRSCGNNAAAACHCVLAERMFDVTVDSIEDAWIEQYCRATGVIDLAAQQVSARVLS